MAALTKDAKALKEATARIQALEAERAEWQKDANALAVHHEQQYEKFRKEFEQMQQRSAETILMLETKADDSARHMNNVAKKCNELEMQLSEAFKQRDETRNELNETRAALVEQRRLNAIQDGYIQRTNEDEDRHDNRNSFRNGPAVRLHGGAVMLAEHDHARRRYGERGWTDGNGVWHPLNTR